MSPEELGPEALEPWVARIGGAATLGSADAAARVGGEVDDAFARLRGRGHDPALLVCDDVFASDGIFAVPPGYLHAAYDRARAAGALCLADEVQAGFGRVGTAFWGFAQDGVRPDIVTLGKPMGNGHPMGAVVTTPEIAAQFAERWHFFSTFAGSPVAAAVGTAVLDVIEREHLAEQAERVGAYLRARLTDVAASHPVVTDVRGPGLFIGVELDVRFDRTPRHRQGRRERPPSPRSSRRRNRPTRQRDQDPPATRLLRTARRSGCRGTRCDARSRTVRCHRAG